MKRHIAVTILALCASAVVVAEETALPVVTLPALTIDGSTVDVTVTYDTQRAVYQYAYTIAAAPANKAAISSIAIDINGKSQRAQIDPDLVNNITRRETRAVRPMTVQPLTSLPVGLISPDPSGTIAGISMDAKAVFSGFETWDVAPGSSRGGFVLESKFAPGPRTVTLSPSQSAWYAIEEKYEGSEVDFRGEGGRTDYRVNVLSVGPSEITEAELYSGGGQQPAEVNKFLRFATPLDNRVKVSAGVTGSNVVVYYGNTILPATFTATLNGVDISAQFHPAPGGADAVRIPIGPGTTKLQLSITGVKVSGGRGTDSDTLTFLPQ